MLIQVDTVKDLVSTNDATVIGVLLAFIAILIYWILRTEKKLEKADEKLEKANTYTKEQDKANLIMLQDLIHTLNAVGQTSEKSAIKIEGVDSKADNILTIINERLTK